MLVQDLPAMVQCSSGSTVHSVSTLAVGYAAGGAAGRCFAFVLMSVFC
jgi:hypothetical protein